MTIKEIYEQYPDQWLLVKVIKQDDDGKITEAEPICNSTKRDEVYEAIGTVRRGEHVATLFTGEIIKEGEAFSF
jgi:hypothetical protein